MSSPPALTLAIDTSGVVAVGLARPGQKRAPELGATPAAARVATSWVEDPRAHAEQLMPLVLRTLAEADADLGEVAQVAVGMGPGPFTGLRVGIATATTLAWGLGVDCRRVCGLDVLAAQAVAAGVVSPDSEFVMTTDARRRELYWARYSGTGQRLSGPSVSRPEEVPGDPVLGPGVALYSDRFAGRGRDVPAVRRLDAGLLAAWADELPDPGEAPLYLRRPDATVPTRRKSTLIVPRLRRRP